jgi:hypothetical protein
MAAIPEQQIANGNDDASKYYNLAPAYFPTISLLYVGYQNGTTFDWCTGLIYRSVPIAQGATILSASITVRGAASGGADCDAKIRAYDADDYADNLSTEAKWDAIFPGSLTTAEVEWNNIPTFAADIWYQSPDISSVIQEIVNRPGWASGNDMVLFIDDHDSRSGVNSYRIFYAFENLAGATSPKLNITYTAAGVIGKVIRINIT